MASSSPAFAEGQGEVRSITVSAGAKIDADPDAASITLGATTEARSARDALSENSNTVSALIEALVKMGVARPDIQTSGLSVNPRYSQPKRGDTAEVRGYVVTNNVSIFVRDLDSLGDILDNVVTLGANRIHGLAFSVSENEMLKDEARTKAIANARRRAELFATAAGAKIGKVLHISEGTAHNPSPRMMMGRRSMAAESVPIEAGSVSLHARVTVTWALED